MACLQYIKCILSVCIWCFALCLSLFYFLELETYFEGFWNKTLGKKTLLFIRVLIPVCASDTHVSARSINLMALNIWSHMNNLLLILKFECAPTPAVPLFASTSGVAIDKRFFTSADEINVSELYKWIELTDGLTHDWKEPSLWLCLFSS